MPIRIEIVSQDRIVYQGDADLVLLPGADGMLGVLPHHTPVLTVIHYGVITIREHGRDLFFTVAGGVAEVQPDQVTVLADAAENVMEIDIQRAEAARLHADETLKKGVPQSTDAILSVQAALRRSNLRLEAVRRYTKKLKR